MMYESDVFHHTYVSSCSSDKFYLIREDSLLQPNTRCYDVCMTHTLEHNTRMTWIKFFEFLAGRLHHVAIDYLESDRCRFTDNLHCVIV